MKLRIFLIGLILAFSGSLSSEAQTLNSVLDPAFKTGSPGSTVTFRVILSNDLPANNTGSDLYLNGISFDLDPPLGVDDTKFFANFPLILPYGQEIHDDLFDILIPLGTDYGQYLGTVHILGGFDDQAMEELAEQNFIVSVVPEPASLALLLPGLAAFGLMIRRKKTSSLTASLTL